MRYEDEIFMSEDPAGEITTIGYDHEKFDYPQGLPSLGRSFLYSDETSDKQHRISRNSDFLLLI